MKSSKILKAALFCLYGLLSVQICTADTQEPLPPYSDEIRLVRKDTDAEHKETNGNNVHHPTRRMPADLPFQLFSGRHTLHFYAKGSSVPLLLSVTNDEDDAASASLMFQAAGAAYERFSLPEDWQGDCKVIVTINGVHYEGTFSL